MEPTKILTINLFDIKVPNNVKLFLNFLNGAKDLARENKALFDKEDIPIDIFHNKEITYSGIQFSRYKGSASFTAIGEKEVIALQLWYDLFQKNTEIPLLNTQIINETYTPILGQDFYYYKLSNFLVKKEIHNEIKGLKNQLAKIDRLEKYLYGNIRTFLEHHLGYEFQKDDFISVKIDSFTNNGFKDTYHEGSLKAYLIKFKTNVYLPQTLRLGQSAALGYGIVQHV